MTMLYCTPEELVYFLFYVFLSFESRLNATLFLILRWGYRTRNCSPLQIVQISSGAHPASKAMSYRGSFPEVKRPERDVDPPPPGAEVKNEQSYVSTPPIFLHGVDRDNFYLVTNGPPEHRVLPIRSPHKIINHSCDCRHRHWRNYRSCVGPTRTKNSTANRN
jgi:hypothetical protein